MQIKSLRIKSYRSWCVADTASQPAIARMKQLELYDTLKSAGLSANLCLQAIGWSKAKYYRWLNRYRQQGWTRSTLVKELIALQKVDWKIVLLAITKVKCQ